MSIERRGRTITYPALLHESWDVVVCDNCKEKISDDPDRIEPEVAWFIENGKETHYCIECVALACPRCRAFGRWEFVDYSPNRLCDQCLEEDDKEGAHGA